MKVAVLMGGLSKEREISLRSGSAVASALRHKGHEVVEVDADILLVDKLKGIKPESVFVALHGKFGEDGTVQGILEWLRIPYTGPSLLSSALCYDKVLTRAALKSINLKMPLGMVYSDRDDIDLWLKDFSRSPLPFPLVVKPSCEGSSIGVERVYQETDLKKVLLEGIRNYPVLLVEEMIEGREVTVGLLNGAVLPVVEVKPKSGFYDFKSKYTRGETEYVVPAQLESDELLDHDECCRYIHDFLKLEGAVRIDFMIRKGEWFFLEVNTIPGMTETSLLPKAAQAAGISFDDLCEGILKTARLKIGL